MGQRSCFSSRIEARAVPASSGLDIPGSLGANAHKSKQSTRSHRRGLHYSVCHGRRIPFNYVRPKAFGWLRWALPLTFVITGLALVPLALPLLPVNETASYAATLGVVPQMEKNESEKPQLPLWLGYKIGWEKFVDDIEAVAGEVDRAELQKTVILVPTYGQAGAIELHGRGRQLPPVYATQNNYFHWGPPPDSVEVAIMAGFSEETVRMLFGEAKVVRIHDCNRCIRWRDDQPIWIARDPKVALKDVWPQLRFYE